MSTMTLTRPARPPETEPPGLRYHCIRLISGPAAVTAARHQVRAILRTWAAAADPATADPAADRPAAADPADAALLTSELVTNAVQHTASPVITLVVTGAGGQFRVDVHDTSGALPQAADVPAEAECGRGLHLVASLSDEWGFYRTPGGKAVYFTLALQPGPAPGAGGRHLPGDGEP